MAEFTQEEKEFFMREALKEAQKSLEKEEIPIGCVIVKDGEIIGRGIMRVKSGKRLFYTLKSWRLMMPMKTKAIGVC